MRRTALAACALALVVSFVITSCAEARPAAPAIAAKASIGRLKVVLKAPAGVSVTVKASGRQHFKVVKPAAGSKFVKKLKLPRGSYTLKAGPARVGGHFYKPNKAQRSLRLGARAKVGFAWHKVAMRRLTNGKGDSQDTSISGDGRFIAFDADVKGNGAVDVYVYDNLTGRVTRVTRGNGWSYNPAISADGRTIAFESVASNLVAGDTNRQGDIFTYDVATHRISRITNGNGPSYAPSISSNGQLIAFTSSSSNLASKPDTNGVDDVFVFDRVRARITPVSDSAGGASSEAALSADGSTVVFSSSASNLVRDDTNGREDVFSFNIQRRQVTRVSNGNADSMSPSVSQDGRYVAFVSLASNLVAGTTRHVNVFWKDTTTGAIRRLTNGNNDSANPSVSGNGRYVAFDSLASNLTAGDRNGRYDVFLADTVTRVTRKATNGKDDSSSPKISLDGTLVAFSSVAKNLVSGDTNGAGDVFVWDR